MLSLVAGKTLGIAKTVNPVIVRLPPPTIRQINGIAVPSSFTPQDWIEYLSMINDDLGTQTNPQARCVVLLAEYFPRSLFPNSDPGGWELRANGLLLQMVTKGAVIVTGSGNIPIGSTIDGWPANFGKLPSVNDLTNIPSLIVAGAITGSGALIKYASDEVGGIPHVYAPVSHSNTRSDATINNVVRFSLADSGTGIRYPRRKWQSTNSQCIYG